MTTEQAPRTETVRPGDNLVQARDLKMYFPVTSGIIFQRKIADVKAVDGVSFDVRRGETLGLVGESGCGKTTLGKVILQLIPPTAGEVIFEGEPIFSLPTAEERKAGKKPRVASDKRMKAIRRNLQVIFQDPYSSLNPRMTVGEIVGEGPLIHG